MCVCVCVCAKVEAREVVFHFRSSCCCNELTNRNRSSSTRSFYPMRNASWRIFARFGGPWNDPLEACPVSACPCAKQAKATASRQQGCQLQFASSHGTWPRWVKVTSSSITARFLCQWALPTRIPYPPHPVRDKTITIGHVVNRPAGETQTPGFFVSIHIYTRTCRAYDGSLVMCIWFVLKWIPRCTG